MASSLLVRVIRRHGFTGSAQEVADQLNAKAIPKTNANRQSLVDVANRYGWPAVTNFQTKLVAAGLQGYLSLLASGVDFSAQASIDAISGMATSGAISNAEAQGLLAMGRWQESVWCDEGGEGVISLSDVTEALAQIAVEDNIESLKRQTMERVDAIRTKLDAGEITDWPGCVSEFGA